MMPPFITLFSFTKACDYFSTTQKSLTFMWFFKGSIRLKWILHCGQARGNGAPFLTLLDVVLVSVKCKEYFINPYSPSQNWL